MSKICNNCGNMVDDEIMFCTNCGATFEAAPAAPEAPVAPAKKPVNKKLIGIIAAVAAVIILAIVLIPMLSGDAFTKYGEMMEAQSVYDYNEDGAKTTVKVEEKMKLKKDLMDEIKDYLEDEEDIKASKISEAYKVWYRVDTEGKKDESHSIYSVCFIKIDGEWYTFSYDYQTNEKGKEEIVVYL